MNKEEMNKETTRNPIGETLEGGKSTDGLECDICGKTFQTKYKLKRHRVIHEERKKYKCEVCGSTLTGKDSYNKHSKRHKNQEKFQDDVPGYVIEDDLGTDKGTECEVCGIDFKTKSKLQKHRQVHKEKSKYCCKICGEEFTLKKMYVRHCKKHKNIGIHDNEHTQQKPVIVCKVCSQLFSSMNTFRVHKKKHLGIRYYCTRCPQSFTTTHQLKLHEKAHDNIRNFHCLQCSSTFKTKSNLTRHMATHEGTRKFVCHICGKAFVLNESLAAHMRVHEDSPLLSCDICQATFKYEKSLKTHYKLHSNQKEFKCSICNREFLRKRTLIDHLKCHEKGTNRIALLSKPSEFCTLCSKGFANAYGLKRHMRKHRLGILKHYNRALGKNLSSTPERNNVTMCPNVKTKTKVPLRNQVVVYSDLVDNGNLFEKIDPKCFVERSTDNISNAEGPYEMKSVVDTSQNTTEKSKMTNGPKDDLEATVDDNMNKNEGQSELKTMDTGCVSLSSFDFKAKEPETPNKTLDNDNEDDDNFDQTFDTSTESNNSVNELENTSKLFDNENTHERVIDDSGESSGTEYVDKAINIEAEAGIEDTFENMTKYYMNDDNSLAVDDDLIDIPEDDNDIEPDFDTSEFSDDENVLLSTSGSYQNHFNYERTSVQQDEKENENLEHVDENVTENNNRNALSKGDIKWVDRIEQGNINIFNESQKDQEFYHENYDVDTDEEAPVLECKICKTGKLFKNKDSFKRHMRKKHKGNSECCFECSKCLKQFFIKTEYEAHIRNENNQQKCETEAPNLQCKFCMTSYSTMKSLRMHLARYHRDDDGTIYTCTNCGKMFASKVLYRNHMDIHLIGKSNARQLCECDICGSEQKSILALRRHKRVAHGIEEDFLFTLDSVENDGIGNHDNQMKTSDDNFDKDELEEEEVDDIIGLNGVGKLNPKYKDLNDVSSEVRDNYVPDLDSESMDASCERVNKEDMRKKHQIYDKHAENEIALVQDIDNVVNKQIETYNNKAMKNSRNLHTENNCGLEEIPIQDFSNNISTKERFQRKFQCIECDKSFHMLSTLKQHMLGHNKQLDEKTKIFQCGQCDKKFVRKSQLLTHSHKFHSKFTYMCNLCPRKFTSVFCLRTHKCVKLGQSKHADKSKLESSSKNDKRGEVNFKCDGCNDTFIKLCCFQVHLRTHSTGRFQCPVCKINFAKWLSLKQHKIEKHGQELENDTDAFSDAKLSLKEDFDNGAPKVAMTFKCSLCSASLSSESNLNRHMRLKHARNDNLSNSETCKECDEILKEQPKVRKKRTFPCESCDQTFQSKLKLRKHLSNVHNVMLNYCNKCSKEFSSLSNLKRHDSIHHSGGDDVQRNFMCSECGRCFTAKDSLRVHMFSHTGERPYQCKQCGATYSRSSHLLRHVKVSHENKLDYVCNYEGCGKRFYEASVLRIHQRSHTDERPYPCPHCSQRFRTKNNRRAHLKTHLLVKQFECSICFQGLTSKNSLIKHLNRHSAADKMNPNSVSYDPSYTAKVRQKVVKKMEEKRFGCNYCTKAFTTTRGVYAHQRKYCGAAKKEDPNVEINARYFVIQ